MSPLPSISQLPGKRGTNGLAIASFVLGLVGLILLSIIFGIVALTKMRDAPQKGKGFAISGLILSGLWLVSLAAVIAVTLAHQAHRSADTGQISQKGSLSVFDLHLGDCFNNPAGASSVGSVTAIPCAQPHNAQVFAQFQLTGTSYPGATAVTHQANKGCESRISGNLNQAKITDTMSVRIIFPQETSWNLGRHTVSCLIVSSVPDIKSSLLKG